MNISEELLYHRLEELYPVERMGKVLHSEHLPIPCFFQMNDENQDGCVYITQVRNLPRSTTAHSLFICVGNYPPSVWSNWGSEIIYINQQNADIFQVFNAVQNIYQTICDWERRMEELLHTSGDIVEMTRCSMNLLNNRICVADYKFSVLAHCQATTYAGKRKMEMVDEYDRIPFDITSLFRQSHAESQGHREPFFIETHEADITWQNYCIPLYIDGDSVGSCSLTEDGRTITASEQLLFRRFADYIARALVLHSDRIGSSFVSLRTIFTDLLKNIPVSHQSLTEAIEMVRQKKGADPGLTTWTCMTLRSANREKDLPAQYICETLEGLLPQSIAFMHEESIVLFHLHPESSLEDAFVQKISAYLEDMNFRMGISYPFTDLYTARAHYLQALCALEYGMAHDSHTSAFGDCVLEHMLRNGCSRFEPDELIPPGLLQLKNLSGHIDYWDTLKRYLDNECNASKTAEELYLHRSSLLPRLEKIRNYVDLDTPEQRLYLRMCIYLDVAFGDVSKRSCEK